MRAIEVSGSDSAIVLVRGIRCSSGPVGSDGEEETTSEMTTMPRLSPRSLVASLRRGTIGVVIAAVLLFGLGFLVFAFSVATTEEPADPHADAIVALTGGRDRVAEAVDLLVAGRGRRLLISGVHPSTRAVDIQKLTDGDRSVFACCVDLGRMAQSTAGNAEEAADWVKAHGFTSLIVVTSAYHMPRSLLELDRALPGVRKIPFAVSRPDLNLETWYLHPATAKLLFSEYVKYIVARFAHQASRTTSTEVALRSETR